MEHLPILDELAVIAALGVLVTVIFSRLKLPTVAGLLFVGALAGPAGLGLVNAVEEIETLAEVGVVLLLFTIGLEFSLGQLKQIFKQVALGGVLQVGLTILVVAAAAMALGESAGRAIFWGCVVSLSSTAIVLRALADRRELDAPHGRFIVGTLIFQDLCVVPMLLIVPLLAGPLSGDSLGTIALAMVKAAAVVIATILVARFVVPHFLDWVDASRNREIFLLAVLALCICTAWLTALAHLSVALGAFLGGMVVADTEYRHRAMGDLLPLRDAFMSIFFVSLGMLFDVRVVFSSPIKVLLLVLAFLVAKAILATIAAMAMKFPVRAAWLAGVGLAQFGEFGFVLTRLGESSGLVDKVATQPLLAAGVISMFLTPLLVLAAPHFTAGERLLAPLEKLFGVRTLEEAEKEQEFHDHVVLVGHGVAGRLVTQALSSCEIPYAVLDVNAEVVARGRASGEPIFYADATSEEALGHVHLKEARALVLLMNDPAAAQRVVDTASRVAPDVPIFTRTRYLAERAQLISMGANDVVAEEVEGGVEIVSRLLRKLNMPRNVIDEQIAQGRTGLQRSDRKPTVPRRTIEEEPGLSDLKIESVLIRPESPAIRCSPVALGLRKKTKALVVALRRGDELVEPYDPEVPFEPGDIAYLVGSGKSVRLAIAVLDPPPEEPAPPLVFGARLPSETGDLI
jgi:CPA2 family monovalent cation:H+ antiporter-2